MEGIAEYVPGEFYKRELPCIKNLYVKINEPNIDCIIVDGFVVLDDVGKLGLGGYLYEYLAQKIPVIGVAKTNFATLEKYKTAVLRGKSTRPLFITALGIDRELAAQNIANMHGEYRMPTLLQLLDMHTKTL